MIPTSASIFSNRKMSREQSQQLNSQVGDIELLRRSYGSEARADPAKISTSLHYDFISFLAAAQKCEVDFLPITWQPALEGAGSGGTAKISQSVINLQISLAFKRTTLPSRSSQEPDYESYTYRALMSEVVILSCPSIREQPNIIKLEGICWEIGGEGQVWPVLVFEKAEFGSMRSFMDSDQGKELHFEDRLKLCNKIGAAIMVMHSCRKFFLSSRWETRNCDSNNYKQSTTICR